MPGVPPTVPPRPGAWAGAPTAAGALPLGATPAPPVVRTRLGDGLLIGLAAAGVAGVAWWALCSKLDTEWWPYTSVLVGVLVGQAVVIGARRGGAAQGLMAALLSAASVFVAVYFITRTGQIQAAQDQGYVTDVPLWNGASAFWDAFHDWISWDAAKAAGWLLAPLAAIVVAARPGARPGLGRRSAS